MVLLHRLKGDVEALNFVEQHFSLVQVIYLDIQNIDSAHEVSENLSNALSATKLYNTFYMSSFLYMLASLHLWVGLPRIENFPDDVKSYEFDPCLQLKNSYVEYIENLMICLPYEFFGSSWDLQKGDLDQKIWWPLFSWQVTLSSSHHFHICGSQILMVSPLRY